MLKDTKTYVEDEGGYFLKSKTMFGDADYYKKELVKMTPKFFKSELEIENLLLNLVELIWDIDIVDDDFEQENFKAIAEILNKFRIYDDINLEDVDDIEDRVKDFLFDLGYHCCNDSISKLEDLYLVYIPTTLRIEFDE